MNTPFSLKHILRCYLIFCFLLPAIAEAANVYKPNVGDPMLERWRWTHFTELDGKGFQCIAETHDGCMWFGVEKGIIRYDGMEWTQYNASNGFFDKQVTAVCVTRDDTLWVAAKQNLSYFKNGVWTTVLAEIDSKINFGCNKIIEASDGSIWVGFLWTALQIKDNKITSYGPARSADEIKRVFPSANFCQLPDKVTEGAFASNIFEDRHGRLWLASSRSALACWDQSKGTIEDPNAWRVVDEALEKIDRWTPQLCQTSQGEFLISNGQVGNAMKSYDYETDKWSVAYAGNISTTRIFESKDGTIWASAHSRIMMRRNGNWRVYEAPEIGLTPDRMYMFESSKRDLWLGITGGKVFRIDYTDRRWSSYEGLHFMGDSPDGSEWFLSVDGAVISQKGSEWTKYNVFDNMISDPVTLVCTKDGRICVGGSHEGVAATAFFENGKWERYLHHKLSWTIDFRSMIEGIDGRIWARGTSESLAGKKFVNGLIYSNRLADGTYEWIHIEPDEQTPKAAVGIAQTSDGKLYFGGAALYEQSEKNWKKVTNPSELGNGWMDAVAVSPSGDLWAARGGIGVFRRHEGVWTHFVTADGLKDIMVSGLLCAKDGTIWASTSKGISRFDGRNWSPNAFASEHISMPRESGTLRQSTSGRIWINTAKRDWYFRAKTFKGFTRETLPEFRSVSYTAENSVPDTKLKVTFTEVSQPGNTLIAWEGRDPWGGTPTDQIEFSYRFNGEEWSDYVAEKEKMFLALKSGKHTFEVRARNRDYNIDPTPATFTFLVIQPVWRQLWLVLLVGAFIAALGVMEYQALRRNYRLRIEVDERKQAQIKVEQQKMELENKKDQLIAQNSQLELEVEQRKRAEVEVAKAHDQLLSVTRKAGMAEVATAILHNVGNVLNSVNVSAAVIADHIQRSKATSISKIADLFSQHSTDLGSFLTQDDKGKKLISHIGLLAESVAHEKQLVTEELTRLRHNIDHIAEIVAKQQGYGPSSCILESVTLKEIIDDAVNMHAASYLKHDVKLECTHGAQMPITTDRHLVLQVIVNILINAKYACDHSGLEHKRVVIRTSISGENQLKLEIQDNGIGISAENLEKIFNHGFTTKVNGHGFGMHNGANAMKQLGGSLSAYSEGLGKGATFTLILPIKNSSQNTTQSAAQV